MDYKDISEEHLNNHVDRIIDICREVPLHKVTILTGGNACGKSVIRKQLALFIPDKLDEEGIPHGKKTVASASMQLRTESHPEWGGFSSITHDLPWTATSYATLDMINKLLRNSDDPRYLIIDELEIGMSEELQIGFCQMLNKKLPELLEKNFGIMIITHSRHVVNTLNHDNFMNIEGMTEEEWVNREIVPIDPEDLEKWAYELFKTIRGRSKPVDEHS